MQIYIHIIHKNESVNYIYLQNKTVSKINKINLFKI